MYSDLIKILLVLFVFSSAGCGLKIGEKNKTEAVAKIQSAECLNQSVDQLKLYFKGNASDEQVAESLQCLQSVFLAFKDNIRGKNKDYFTPTEIINFVTEQFLKDGNKKISIEFLNEIVKLKVLLVGGTLESITKSEIDGLVDIIARLRPELVKLNPHMKIVMNEWVPNLGQAQNDKKFSEAKRALNSLLNQVAQLLATTQRTYALNDLMNLAVEIAKFTKANESTIKKINEARELIIKFKSNLIGGGQSLSGDEWYAFTKTLGEVYFQFLRISYFYDDLTDNQVTQKWNVYENIAVDISNLLHDLLKAKSSKEISNHQIMELLSAAKPLLSNFNINSELVQQIGQIKVVFLGKGISGSNGWSQEDFLKLSSKAPNLFKNLAILFDNFKYLKTNKTDQLKIKYEDFVSAENAVLAAVQSLSSEVVESYDLESLKGLIMNLSETLLKDTLKLPDNFNDLFELLTSAKLTLTGEAGSGVSNSGIKLLLNVGIRVYAHSVEYVNYISIFKYEDREFIFNLEKLVNKAGLTLNLELKLKTNHKISTQEISQLIMVAQNKKFINTQIKTESLEKALNAAWSHLLNKPELRLAGEIQEGFNTIALSTLEQEVHLWLFNQKTIADIFTKKPEFSKEELLFELSTLLSEIINSDDKVALEEIKKALEAKGSMNFDSKGVIKILTDTNGRYHLKDLYNSNLARSFSRLLIRAFANDISRIHNLVGVSLEETQFAYNQLKYLAYDLDLVDPNNLTFIESRFREASLFLAPSDGDDYASFSEVHHLVLHIMSGLVRAESLNKLAKNPKNHCQTESAGAKVQFNQTCLLDMYFNERKSFEFLPDFLELRKNAKQDGSLNSDFCKPAENNQNAGQEDCKILEANKTYYLSLLKAAGHIENEKNTVFEADAALFPHVVQYIEMIYSTHDTNLSHLLERDEALRAFPIFKNLITLLAKPFTSLKEDDIPGVFIYLLKYGRPPKTLAEKLKFAAFVKDHVCKDENGNDKACMKDWNIESTRYDLGKIFNFIADATKPVPP